MLGRSRVWHFAQIREIASLRSQKCLREEHRDEAISLNSATRREIASLRSQRRLREEHHDEAISHNSATGGDCPTSFAMTT